MVSDSEDRRSQLFYYGTDTEVELGDRVVLKRWLRKDQAGVVCYIPGISRPHREMEYEDVKQWAIRAQNGSIYPILYHPESFQPPKGIRFRGRGHGGTLEPGEHLE